VGEFALDRRANDERAFQFTAWEVEKATMDVHTGEIRYRSDPSATAVVPVSAGAGQGQLFDDPGGRSFADTDQLPAVGRGRRASNRYGAPRWLRVTIVAVVIGILAAGGALALVKTGVIGKTTSPPARAHTNTNTTTPPAKVVHTKTLLTPAQTFGGAGSGNYTIPARAFLITVTSGVGRSWVSIGIVGQTPIYQGILSPNSSQRELLLGPAQVSIGAGGTSMTVTSGHKSQTLTPPSAPFTYQITPAG
jgi:hypothetical protein